jgi:PAS domain S-box-containing protein
MPRGSRIIERFASLRFRMILLVLLATLPALGLVFYDGLEQRRLAAAETQKEALRLARLVARDQQWLIEGADQLLKVLVQLPAVRDRDPAACSALFADLTLQSPRYANFVASEPDGDVFCSGEPLPGSVNFCDRAWFQQALETRDFVVGDYVIGRITGKALLVFARPALDEAGQVQAVVSSGLDLAWLGQMLAEADLPAGSTFMALDRHGTILAHSPDTEALVSKTVPEAPLVQTILAQQEGTVELAGLDGITRLYAFAPLGRASDVHEGYVAIGISSKVAYAEAQRAMARNLALLGLVATLALLTVWVGSEVLISRPVRAVLRATEQLAAGDLSIRARLHYGTGELRQLAGTFDRMVEALGQKEAERQQAEASLRERDEQFQSLLQTVNDVVWAASADGSEFLYFSEATERIYGRPLSEFRENPDLRLEVVHPEDRERVEKGSEALFTQGHCESEYRIFRPDGQVRWLYDRKNVVYNDGTPVRIGGLATDITERKQAEQRLAETLRFTQTILETSPLGMVTYCVAGQCVSANEAAAQIIGATRDQVLHQNFYHIESWKRSGLLDAAQEALASGNEQRREINLTSRFGQTLWLDCELVPFASSGEPHLLLIFGDVTERKGAEEALRRSLEETAHSQRLLLALSQAAQAVQRARTADEVYRAIGDSMVQLGFHAVIEALSDDRVYLTIPYLSFEPALLQQACNLAGVSVQDYRIPLVPGTIHHRLIAEGHSMFFEQEAEPLAEALPESAWPLTRQIAAVLGLGQPAGRYRRWPERG